MRKFILARCSTGLAPICAECGEELTEDLSNLPLARIFSRQCFLLSAQFSMVLTCLFDIDLTWGRTSSVYLRSPCLKTFLMAPPSMADIDHGTVGLLPWTRFAGGVGRVECGNCNTGKTPVEPCHCWKPRNQRTDSIRVSCGLPPLVVSWRLNSSIQT